MAKSQQPCPALSWGAGAVMALAILPAVVLQLLTPVRLPRVRASHATEIGADPEFRV